MTNWSVNLLFAFEGCMIGLFSLFTAVLYGLPLLYYLAKKGIVLPSMVQQSQFAIGLTLYPKYGLKLFIMTGMILIVSVIIVSFLPTRRITKLNPTAALKGK